MDKKIIFVAGIHGVGKSVFCEKLSKKYNIETFSCSELISRGKEINLSNKLTKEINENQQVLKEAINNYLIGSKQYILDGHLCLLNKDSKVERIPIDIFRSIGIKKIILLITDIQIIHLNLRKRDNKEYSFETLTEFQNHEIKYAKEICKSLDVPLEIKDPYKI